MVLDSKKTGKGIEEFEAEKRADIETFEKYLKSKGWKPGLCEGLKLKLISPTKSIYKAKAEKLYKKFYTVLDNQDVRKFANELGVNYLEERA